MKIYLIFLFAALIIANEEGNSDRIYANEWSIEQNKDNNEDSTYAKVISSSTKRMLTLMKIPQIVLIPVVFPVLFPFLLIILVKKLQKIFLSSINLQMVYLVQLLLL